MVDLINSPPHYRKRGGPEVIEVIESWGADYHLGNAIKYLYRWDLKGSARENIEKARWYINRRIELGGSLSRRSGVDDWADAVSQWKLDADVSAALAMIARAMLCFAPKDQMFDLGTAKVLLTRMLDERLFESDQ